MRRARVVIIGGGFAGLQVARNLRSAHLDITLVDKRNHHLFQPLLYQVATAALSPAEISYPIREIFKNQKNVSVVMGEVVSIHKEEKKIELENGDSLGYDYLVLAPGASHSYFGQDQWAAVAPGIKTLHDAIQIREKILLSFELAERLASIQEETSHLLNFVIIGGGPTGVELAGAIADIAHSTLCRNFRHIHPEESRIILIEALPRILPSYSLHLSERAKKDLEQIGVEVITGQKVTGVHRNGVQIGDHFLPSNNIIWAAGNQASSLLKSLRIPLDNQGRVRVLPDLTIPDYPEIFVIGDACHLQGKENTPLPATASVAVQQGKYVASLLRKIGTSVPRKPFLHRNKGNLATIGKGKAIAQIGKLEFGGLPAWLFWGTIHVLYLIGFRNRLHVLLEWALAFLSGRRRVRIILGKTDPKLPPTKQ